MISYLVKEENANSYLSTVESGQSLVITKHYICTWKNASTFCFVSKKNFKFKSASECSFLPKSWFLKCSLLPQCSPLKFHFSPNVHFPRNEFFSASFVLKVSRWESCFIKGGSRLSSPLSTFNWKLPSTLKLRLWLWGGSIHIMLQLKQFHWEQRWIWKLETWTQFEIVTRSFTYCTKTTWWDKEWRMGHFKL